MFAALTSLALLSWQPVLHRPVRAAARHRPSLLCDSDDSAAEGLPMDILASRIAAMSAEMSTVRLFVLDAMVPGQRLSFAAPPQLVETMKTSQHRVVMFGVDPGRRLLCTHGTSVSLEQAEERDDGDWDVVLTAEGGRLCELVELGDDEGSRWSGREAQVRWLSLDSPDETMTDALLARSAALEKLVDQWASLVRGGRERSPNQLDGVIKDLGPMPDADAPSARALWIAGLINPLPALGVALEIRPAALQAPTAEVRLQVVEVGLQDSIKRLQSPGPLF